MKRLILTEIPIIKCIYCWARRGIPLVLVLLLHACSSMPSLSSYWPASSEERAPRKHTMRQQTLSATSTTRPRHIAVLLPSQGTFARPASSVRAGILYAKQEDRAGDQVAIRFYDTSNAAGVATIYREAVNDGADFVIGPLTKENVTQLLRSTSITVPTLALNYTNTSKPTRFYEIGLMPEDEIQQMLIDARKKGLSRALLIAPQSSFGTRLSKPLVEHWQAKGGRIIDTLYFNSQTNFSEAVPRLLHIDVARDTQLMKTSDRNKTVLENQRRQDFDVIFLITKPREARAIVPLLRYYYVNNVPIYAPASVYAEPDPISDVDLNGVHVCDIPASQIGDRTPLSPNHRLYALGKDAYLISQSIGQLEQINGFTLPGDTGELSLNNRRQIQREITCGTMRNGYLSPA